MDENRIAEAISNGQIGTRRTILLAIHQLERQYESMFTQRVAVVAMDDAAALEWHDRFARLGAAIRLLRVGLNELTKE